MKKLLFQLDTDIIPNTFDTVVAYDGGADHVSVRGGITPENVGTMVDGAIFTRGMKDKKHTALFISGSNMAEGEDLLDSITAHFFDGFRVSVMLDSNGSNTTAAAAAAKITRHVDVAGKRTVILAGTGPVGQRAAVMLARAGSSVTITSRKMARSRATATALKRRFGVQVEAAEAADPDACEALLDGAAVVLSTGAAGVRLLREHQWKDHPTLEILVDANATPPLGLEGVDMNDAGTERHGKVCFGALGFGALKIKVHRRCISQLFETNDLVLDAEQIYEIAREMA